MDPQLKAQLLQVVSYALTSSTADIYGQTQVGSTATLFARVEPRVREVENDNGTFSRTSHMVVVDAVSGFTPTLATRLWLPDARIAAGTAATYYFTLAGTAEDGDQVTLIDTAGINDTVAFGAGNTATDIADLINASIVAITASASGDTVNLTQDSAGTAGNTAVSFVVGTPENWAASGVNFVGGGNASVAATDMRNPKVIHPCFGERGALEHWEILV